MLDALDFVKGAVATRDIVEALTHFCIRDGVVQASNGRITITSYANELKGITAVVDAQAFVAAMEAAEGEPEFDDTQPEHLIVRSGRFKAKLPLLPPEVYPFMERDTKKIKAKGDGLYEAMEALAPFMAEDATRPWACGMLFNGNHAYATNNIILARCELPFKIKRLNVPVHAIEELLKIKYEPAEICTSDHSITFMYDDDSWLRTTLIDTDWPDVDAMLKLNKRMPLLVGRLYDDVKKLLPFCPDSKFPVVKFSKSALHTLEGDMDAEITGYTLPEGAYRIEPLLAVLNVCTHIDFSKYPAACPWRGVSNEIFLEGVIIGVRI